MTSWKNRCRGDIFNKSLKSGAYIRFFGSVDAKIGDGLDLTMVEMPVVLRENSLSDYLVIGEGKLYNYAKK